MSQPSRTSVVRFKPCCADWDPGFRVEPCCADWDFAVGKSSDADGWSCAIESPTKRSPGGFELGRAGVVRYCPFCGIRKTVTGETPSPFRGGDEIQHVSGVRARVTGINPVGLPIAEYGGAGNQMSGVITIQPADFDKWITFKEFSL